MTRAVLMEGPGKPLEVGMITVHDPGPGEIRVAIAAAGVCHSDYHVFERGPDLIYPCVLGHEASGEVLQVGADVPGFAVGDHVVLCVYPQCGRCEYCTHGAPTLCVEGTKTGRGTLPSGTSRLSVDGRPVGQLAGLGAWSEETTISALSAVRIDPEMPLLPAALLGCGVVTGFGAVSNVARVQSGDTIAVVGCGGLGLNAIQAGRIAGAEKIIAIDTNPGKLALATSLGATHCVNAATDDVLASVLDLTGGIGVNAAFDFVVNRATVRQSLTITRRGGTVVLTGLAEESLEFTLTDIVRAGRTLKGNLMGMGDFTVDFAKLVNLYQSGDLLLDQLVSRRFALDEANAALDAFGEGDVARSVFVINDGL